jgi:hypothetical protein
MQDMIIMTPKALESLVLESVRRALDVIVDRMVATIKAATENDDKVLVNSLTALVEDIGLDFQLQAEFGTKSTMFGDE